MKTGILIVSIFFAGHVFAQDTLCVKKRVRLASGKVKLAKAVKARDGSCPRGFKAAFSHPEPATILSDLSTVDGTGSGLDADLLDGQSSADFASAAAVQSISSTVSALNSAVSALQVDNVVRVAKNGGDYSSLSDAIDSLSSPGTSNPYLIIIGPGVYELDGQVTIPGGVTVSGSGTGATILESSVSGTGSYSPSAAIILQKGAVIKDLTLTNDGSSGSGEAAAGISVSSVNESLPAAPGTYSTRIERVAIEVIVATFYTAGIHNSDADLVVKDSSIRLGSGTVSNIAIVGDSVATFERLHVNGCSIYTSGAFSIGLYSGSSSAAVYLTDTTIESSGGNGAAIRSEGGDVFVSRSTLISDNIGLVTVAASARINATQIQINANTNAVVGSGTIACSFVTELATGTGYTNTCS